MITYRPADINDLDDISALVQSAVIHMESMGIHQWDDIYPSADDFRNDIEKGCAFSAVKGGSIAAVYSVNRDCDEQYANGSWQYTGDDFIVIHRLCVAPAYQHQGIAKAILNHIEDEAGKCGNKAVKLDVFSENPYAVRLYENNGYKKVGTAVWRKGMFYLMEKLL